MYFYYGMTTVDMRSLVLQRYEVKVNFIPYLLENYLTSLDSLRLDHRIFIGIKFLKYAVDFTQCCNN